MNKIENFNKNAEFIKIFALIAMTIDHIGYLFIQDSILSDESLFMFLIGRTAFPLFAFLVAYRLYQDCCRWKSYIPWLLGFGVIAEPFHMWYFSTQTLNILFTLGAGVFVIGAIKSGSRYFAFFGTILAFAFAYFTSYGIIGVASIPAIYLILEKFNDIDIGFLIGTSMIWISMGVLFDLETMFILLPGYIVCIFIFYSYRILPGTKLRIPKIGWYAYYPAHLVILSFIKIYF